MQQALQSLLDLNSTRICNCGDCSTMILRSLPPIDDENSTACMVPTLVAVSFSHHSGFINGARIQMHWTPLDISARILTLKKDVLFLPYFSDEEYQKSR
ncbi:hypothetical protein WR25_23920 [Diploscapter pachys]|uniref:Uncharacterized protein n=1 Tax=Diploscapter pachys TaxID=2018661 RepID=A0A2A2J9E5_9BILA|nr:hypothetical protein WR25_23920 [Diploscapter pachys]